MELVQNTTSVDKIGYNLQEQGKQECEMMTKSVGRVHHRIASRYLKLKFILIFIRYATHKMVIHAERTIVRTIQVYFVYK